MTGLAYFLGTGLIIYESTSYKNIVGLKIRYIRRENATNDTVKNGKMGIFRLVYLAFEGLIH